MSPAMQTLLFSTPPMLVIDPEPVELLLPTPFLTAELNFSALPSTIFRNENFTGLYKNIKQILQKRHTKVSKKALVNFYENTIASVFPCDDIFWIAATEETGKSDPECPAHVDIPVTIDQWVDGGVKEYEEKFDVIQRLL